MRLLLLILLLWTRRLPADELPQGAAKRELTLLPAPIGTEEDLPLPPAPTAGVGRLRVLAIGVGRYAERRLQLKLPAADARDVSFALQAQRGKAFADVEVRLLLDEQADRAAILGGITWLLAKSRAGDVSILFLAGHGVQDPEAGYLFLPVDAAFGDLPGTSVSGTTLQTALERIRGHVLVLMDTCHAGAVFSAGARPAKFTPTNAGLRARPQVTVIAASSSAQTAREDSSWGHGAFSLAIIEALRGTVADSHRDGRVTQGELVNYVSRRVAQLVGEGQQPTEFKYQGNAALLLALVPGPLYKKAWFWSVVGILAAGAATGIVLSLRFPPDPPGTLPLVPDSGGLR